MRSFLGASLTCAALVPCAQQVSTAQFAKVWDELPEELITIPEDSPPPEALSHYTDDTGMRGILVNRVVWATHYRFLNDPTELVVGCTDVVAVLEAALDNAPSDQSLRRVLLAACRPFRHLLNGSKLSCFVASFCEKPDWLTLWRNYADDGHGYSLTFTDLSECGKGFFKDTGCISTLLRCLYSQADFRSRLEHIIKDTITGFLPVLGAQSDSASHALLRDEVLPLVLQSKLLGTLMARKHEAYEDEHEWRIVVIPFGDYDKSAISYRDTQHGTCPYLQLPITERDVSQPFGFTSVTAGPSQGEFGQDRLAAELPDLGYASTLALGSKVPYRSARPAQLRTKT